MSERPVGDLRAQLGGRTKRELIDGMIVRSPHELATSRVLAALEPYPLLLLMLARDHPTKLWILDRGEKVSSAEILTPRILRRRWHSAGIGVDDCEGLTDVAPGYVAVVTTWRTLLVVRHEFAHAATTFFSDQVRQQLRQLYEAARLRGQFTEPLAAESVGEYAACGLSYCLFPDLRAELQSVDPGLHRLASRFLARAEEASARMAGPGGPEVESAGPIRAGQTA